MITSSGSRSVESVQTKDRASSRAVENNNECSLRVARETVVRVIPASFEANLWALSNPKGCCRWVDVQIEIGEGTYRINCFAVCEPRVN